MLLKTVEPDDSRLREFTAGVRGMLPLLLGVVPFGMIFGVLSLGAGIPPLETQALSLFVFAGSAQFISAGMVGDGVAPFIIVLTIFLVNVRHALYSATLAPYLEKLSLRWKLPIAWLLTDEAFVMSSLRYRRGQVEYAHWYALGGGLLLWATWQLSTGLGIVLGAVVPEGLSLEFALPLTFIVLLIPSLSDRPSQAAAVSAGLVSVALAGLPFRVGLLLGAVVGVGVGLAVEMRQGSMRPSGGEGV